MKTTVITLILTALLAASVGAHCQIPCGIYDDTARITEMKEHVTTIEKSMNEITKLSAETPQNSNQLVRWVNNKEAHADKLTDIVTYYFLAQRIKPDTDNYDAKLKTLHGMMIAAMKSKQTVDLEQVEKLRALIAEFETLYFDKAASTPHTH
ncbi:MAG: superoxide dismutase [Kiritimatiellales bacterium]|nr:superoxide dismutase [Kiritimatiellota bacterium]MBL7012523.1 superoxide dismutase [Kiritimatiellales bacterium]